MLDLHSLNPQQRRAVETLRGPVLILAGAGTGKTRVITARVANLIRNRVLPGHILAVTFTNKAAREMQERVNELLPKRKKGTPRKSKEDRPTISTFHSLCVRILRRHIHHLGYKPNFVIYSQADQIGTVKRVLSRIHIKGTKIDPYGIQSWISRVKNASPDAVIDSTEVAHDVASHLRQQYDNSLRACNAVDFDDLILLTLRLFHEKPEVLESCRDRYRYVMVDEYQDTNSAQFELIHFLTREHRNLCVVGDDDQSIYAWRGADVTNLLDMEKHYPEVQVIKLEQNYRSTNMILTAANAVIKNNSRRRAKNLWSENGTGERIIQQVYETDEEEAQAVVDEIEAARISRSIPWRDQAILFRTNQQSRVLETALRQGNIRYHLVGGKSFFDRREIRDFLAYLKVLVNPLDDNSLLRIANVPARGLSDRTMEQLLAHSHERNTSVFAVMRHTDIRDGFPSRARNSIEDFSAFIEECRSELEAEELDLAEWTRGFFNEIGFFEELRRSEKNQETAENRVRNIQDLIDSLNRSPQTMEAVVKRKGNERLQSFLEEITLDEDSDDDKPRDEDSVTLITMHSCKGLEFPHVQIVGAEEGLIPHSRSRQEGTVDEERRLFYVAITRARQTLTISYCLGRNRYGTVQPCHPSPFLKELPEEVVEVLDAGKKKPVAGETGKNFFAAMRAAIND